MGFKNLKIPSEFQASVTSKVCYIYKVDTDNGSIARVHYYRFEDKAFTTRFADTEFFATQLMTNRFVAYCGKIVNGQLTEIAKVLPMVKDGKPYLTTMADDTKSNNLVTLSDYYK